MEITIRLGHGLAQNLGNSRLRVTLNEGASIADLVEQLKADHPSMAAQLAASVAVISGNHVKADELLSGEQEVALLMPISGGSDD